MSLGISDSAKIGCDFWRAEEPQALFPSARLIEVVVRSSGVAQDRRGIASMDCVVAMRLNFLYRPGLGGRPDWCSSVHLAPAECLILEDRRIKALVDELEVR